MSFLSDVLAFEKFNAKDIWKKIKKDPERLLLGAADPYSSKLWSKVTGKDYEPLVDQMGGAYGGHTLSGFGNQTGGVFGRARDAGINPTAGGQMHDVAHIISAMIAGGQLGGGGQGGMGQGGMPNQMPNFNPMGQQQSNRDQQLAESNRLIAMILSGGRYG